MILKRVFCVIALLTATTSYADDSDYEKLASVTTDYSRCLDVTMGNFESEQESQKAMKLFYTEIIKNIKTMINEDLAKNRETVRIGAELMGKEILAGYILKGFAEVNPEYQNEKKALNEKYKWDWRRVNIELWSKHGCNTIYSNLKK